MRRNIKGRPLGVGFECPAHSLRALSRDNKKHIGMDIHKGTISIAVMNPPGKVVMRVFGRSEPAGTPPLLIYIH
jgi:hypothetical protein